MQQATIDEIPNRYNLVIRYDNGGIYVYTPIVLKPSRAQSIQGTYTRESGLTELAGLVDDGIKNLVPRIASIDIVLREHHS